VVAGAPDRDPRGLLDEVAALSVGAQQYGMVCLDEAGGVVGPALLWNDTRLAQAATDLVAELGGPQAGPRRSEAFPCPVSPSPSCAGWPRTSRPAKRAVSVLLPHDWLTWRLTGGRAEPVTNRGDASGTGYWSPNTGDCRPDLLGLAFGRVPRLPRVLAPTLAVMSWKGSPGAMVWP
jgi:xylulokinase